MALIPVGDLKLEVNAIAPRNVWVNDSVLKAVVETFVRVPASNAIWSGGRIQTFGQADIAVAVAIEGGPMAPVLRGVNRRGIVDIAAAVAEAAEGARAGEAVTARARGRQLRCLESRHVRNGRVIGDSQRRRNRTSLPWGSKKRPVVSEAGELEVARS